jgi:serine/threonine protein kinase
MLSLIGIGNYAKVVLVRKKSSGKLYAMKIMKKRLSGQDTKDSKINKSQAFIEKEILVTIFFYIRPNVTTHSSSTSTAPSSTTANFTTFWNTVRAGNSLESSKGTPVSIRNRTYFHNFRRTKFYAAQIFLALEYMHSQNYLYRE